MLVITFISVINNGHINGKSINDLNGICIVWRGIKYGVLIRNTRREV